MKKRIISFIIIFTLTISLTLFPISKSINPFAILPPICYTEEVYSSDNSTNDELFDQITSGREVKFVVRSKLFDSISKLFKRLFS